PAVADRSRTRFDTDAVPPFMVKGKSAPVHAFALGAEVGDRGGTAREHSSVFVGRGDDLRVLQDVIARAATEGGEVVEIVGDAGIGKSRLVREATPGMQPSAFVVRGEPTGTTTPYRAFREPLRRLLAIERGEQRAMAEQLRAAVVAVDATLEAYVP